MKKRFSKSLEAIKLAGNERTGLLVAHYGASADIEDEEGQIHRCHLRKNLDAIVVGDRVLWQPDNEESGTVVSYLPRESLLVRPETNGKIKPIAANIDIIIIVTIPPPILSEHLIDRYLVAAEHVSIPCCILLNKMDLLNETTREETQNRLAIYEKIGYPVMHSSTFSQESLQQLSEFLKNKTGVLVGASGVGKSSIIAALTQQTHIKIGDTSSKGVGKHTTTTTRLYHLPNGGILIDSPGVREFGLWNMNEADILRGFKEFHHFLNHCKFSDCHHQKEPGCALQKAIAENKISERRFNSYLEMMETFHK